MLTIDNSKTVKPLEKVTVTADSGDTIRIYDGQGRLYAEGPGPEYTFAVSGTLGYHVAAVFDKEGKEVERTSFKVDCRTEIDDNGGRFKKMLYMLLCTFEKIYAQKKNRVCDGERIYHQHIITSRDTIHVHKGAKYFFRDLKDIIDLHSKHQREDGMVWDFCIPLEGDALYHFEWRWGDEFHKLIPERRAIFARQPVMNDLEHMYIGGVYQIWQATGDDDWMKGKLDSALAAMEFSRTSPYIWSEKFQLMKRPYCLDLWDFQSDFDAELVGGDEMDAKPGVTKYGVFHGDNTGMADSCRKLAEMCELAGRSEEAKDAREYSEHILKQLEKVAWNGKFYTHHVSEDPSFKRDFGVDESTQVSLSNGYAVNRGIGHDKVKSIIETYKDIKENLPEGSPAEWFQMYPPFPKGWHIPPWIYTNGAVTILVAGELARGCFEHGYEEYGADIMKRALELFEPYGDSFIGGLWGKRPEEPERKFTQLNISTQANAGLACRDDSDVPGWGGEPGNDMASLPTGRQVLEKIPFDIIEPEKNDGRSCIRIAKEKEGWADTVNIPVGSKAESLYLLHACSGSGKVIGTLTWNYTGGSNEISYVMRDEHVLTFWNPDGSDFKAKREIPKTVLAWTGSNESIWRIGLTAAGFNNPHPDRKIESITLTAGYGKPQWFVVSATLSDTDVWFEPGPFGGGAPPNWSAGALMYALAEGLAGVVDSDRNMQAVTIAPRWNAADVSDVTACIKYEEGGGYVRYEYSMTDAELNLKVSSSGENRNYRILLPEDAKVLKILLDGKKINWDMETVEQSVYICFVQNSLKASEIKIELMQD